MAIKFYCRCGQRLRAPEGMAARRLPCPACGAPVGVPSLQPTQRGTEVRPLAAFEPRRPVAAAAQAPTPRSADCAELTVRVKVPPPHLATLRAASAEASCFVRLRAVPRSTALAGAGWWNRLETRWYECLRYPLRLVPQLLGIAATLAVLAGLFVLFLPEIGEWGWPGAAFAALLLVPAAYVTGLLDGVLTAALAGEVRRTPWAGGRLHLIGCGLARAVTAFLAGPILPAAAAAYYGIVCGLWGLVDVLIVAELLVLAVGYWLGGWLLLCQRGRLRDLHPRRILGLAQSLGTAAGAGMLTATALVLTHAWLAACALALVHAAFGWGVLLLFLVLLSGLAATVALLRWWGLRLFRCRVEGR